MVKDSKGNLHDELGRFTSRYTVKSAHFGELVPGRGEPYPGAHGDTPQQTSSIPLDFFGKKQNFEKPDLDKLKRECPKEVYGFQNRQRLYTSHHQRHAAEMGYKSQSVYEKAANIFWKFGKGSIYYSPIQKVYYKYCDKSEEFVSVDSDGVVHTYMTLTREKMHRKFVQERLYEIDMSDM